MNEPTKADAEIVLVAAEGGTAKLDLTVRELIIAAEGRAQRSGTPTPESVDAELREAISRSDHSVSVAELNNAVRAVEAMRKSLRYRPLEITVTPFRPTSPTRLSSVRTSAPPEGIFEPERHYPDPESLALFDRLAGIDAQKTALVNEIAQVTSPARVQAWSLRHHARRNSTLLTANRQRVPLIVLQGDVGTGKTALAESVGATLVKQRVCSEVRLLKMTGQVRGQGLVGQMSDEIVKAFAYAEVRAKELGPDTPLLLLVDEADALATSRAGEQMHHEDKAGVNTLLQRLDRLKTLPNRPVVIFITNRPGAVDPAIARRAGMVLKFERPTSDARKAILGSMLSEYGFSAKDIERLGRETERRELSYTASDLVDRILVWAVQEAVRLDKPLSLDIVLEAVKCVEPSPSFA